MYVLIYIILITGVEKTGGRMAAACIYQRRFSSRLVFCFSSPIYIYYKHIQYVRTTHRRPYQPSTDYCTMKAHIRYRAVSRTGYTQFLITHDRYNNNIIYVVVVIIFLDIACTITQMPLAPSAYIRPSYSTQHWVARKPFLLNVKSRERERERVWVCVCACVCPPLCVFIIWFIFFGYGDFSRHGEISRGRPLHDAIYI